MINRELVKVVGFDLDQTLYPKAPEIDVAIQAYIHKKISLVKGCSIEEGRCLFESYYPKLSGRKALLALGIDNAAGIVQEALERADIAPFLVPDKRTLQLLTNIKKGYSLALVTGSEEAIAHKKLAKLNIPRELFDVVITGEISKSDGTAYKKWVLDSLAHDSSLMPKNFLYVGDRKSTDVDIPRSLSMQAVLVYASEGSEEFSLNQENSIAVCSSLFDIENLLL